MSSTYKLWFWLGPRKLNDRCQKRAVLADSSTYLDRIMHPESHWASCHRWAAFPVWNKKCTCFRSVFCFYMHFILTLRGLIVVGIFNFEGIFLQKNKNEFGGFFLLWLMTFMFTFSEGFWSRSLLFFRRSSYFIMHYASMVFIIAAYDWRRSQNRGSLVGRFSHYHYANLFYRYQRYVVCHSLWWEWDIKGWIHFLVRHHNWQKYCVLS